MYNVKNNTFKPSPPLSQLVGMVNFVKENNALELKKLVSKATCKEKMEYWDYTDDWDRDVSHRLAKLFIVNSR